MTNSEKLANKPKKFMLVKVNESLFGIPLAQVREVIGLDKISPLPKMPKYFAGIINLRGRIISVIDLKISLNFLGKTSIPQSSTQEQKTKSRRPCIIITEINGQIFGAIVDEIIEVNSIQETAIDHSSDHLNTEMISGIIKKSTTEIAPILILEKVMRISELVPQTNNNAA